MSLINYITQVQFEFGAIDLLQQECDRLGIRHPLIVTDPGVRATGLCDKVLGKLADRSKIGIFDQTPPNPNEQAVRAAADMYRDGRHDGIIAIGGGSSIDLAKGTARSEEHTSELQSLMRTSYAVLRLQKKT